MNRDRGLTSRQSSWIRMNTDITVNLPHPDETWYFEDTDLSKSQFGYLQSYNIIEKVERDGKRFRWTTKKQAYDRFVKYCEEYDVEY